MQGKLKKTHNRTGDVNCKICDLINGNKEEIPNGGKIMIKMITENKMSRKMDKKQWNGKVNN